MPEIFSKIGDFFAAGWHNFVGFFSANVEPVVVSFLKQFTTDFGKAALEQAAPFAAAVIAGSTPIGAAADGLLAVLGETALTIAEQDGKTVALNAIRLHIESQKIADASTTAPVAPAETAAPAADAAAAPAA